MTRRLSPSDAGRTRGRSSHPANAPALPSQLNSSQVFRVLAETPRRISAESLVNFFDWLTRTDWPDEDRPVIRHTPVPQARDNSGAARGRTPFVWL